MTKDYQDDVIVPDDHMPQPAPGRRVISFSLPETSAPTPVTKRARKPKVQKEIDEYEQATAEAAVDFSAFNLEDYRDLSTAPRRRSREVALLLLFAATRGADLDETWSFARNILKDTGIYDDNAVFAMDLARRAYAMREQSDAWLTAYARDWTIDRFPSVDLAILRLACSELAACLSAPNVVINEAVELGKKFGTDESPAFINGLLDNIYNHEIKTEQNG